MTDVHHRLTTLADLLGDRLLTPASPGFGSLAAVPFHGEPRVPAALARPRTTAEVAAAVRAARDHGLPYTVRSGGHSYTRAGSLDGGLVIDLRLMEDVRIDAARRIGSVQGGATAGAYTAAAGEHGLATGFGDSGTVGVAGLALGGGIGFLSRRDGLTADNLLGAEVVLPDGTVAEVGPDAEPEVFWALRGAGAALGVVVTRLDLRLTPTDGVVGGMLAWPAEAGTLADVAAALAAAPAELGGMVNAMLAPPMPMIPADLHGRPVVAALVCWSGEAARADDVLAPLRARTLLADTVEAMPYPAMFEGGGPEIDGLRIAGDTGFTEVPDESAAAEILDVVGSAPGPSAAVNLRPMGGAIARVDAGGTAFAHRDRPVMTTLAGLTPDADQAPAVRQWAADGARRLGLDTGPAYVNFMTGTAPGDLARAYPGATGERLDAVRRAIHAGGAPAAG